MRRFVGGHIYNVDAVAATVILAHWDGSTETEYARIDLEATYYRYIFNQDDIRDLGVGRGIRIKTADAFDTTGLTVIGRYTDQ
jgi:hypothetical protein